MEMSFLSLVLVILYAAFVECTVDLNIHQLQMVADHLEMTECKRLVNALHQNTFELSGVKVESDEPDKPCIAMLLQWDRTDGDGKSFDDLAFRLGQIGRRDLSEKLSSSVYGEKADALDRLFLSDPFKKSVPKNSLLLDVKKKRTGINSGKDEDDFSAWEIVSVISGSIIAVCIIIYVIYYFFGSALVNLFRRYAPDFVVKWFDMVSGECTWFCKKMKTRYYKHVVGSRSEGTRTRRKSLTELNRNLNCYLNGNSIEASRYFDELMRNL